MLDRNRAKRPIVIRRKGRRIAIADVAPPLRRSMLGWRDYGYASCFRNRVIVTRPDKPRPNRSRLEGSGLGKGVNIPSSSGNTAFVVLKSLPKPLDLNPVGNGQSRNALPPKFRLPPTPESSVRT